MAYDQRTADVERELETAQALLAESERMRDSLRLQVAGAEHTRRKDNEYLLAEIEMLRRVGDQMQSSLSRITEWVSQPWDKQEKVPYEVAMACVEGRSSVDQWTVVRRGAVAPRETQAPKENHDA